MSAMIEQYGLRGVTVALDRLLRISQSLPRNTEYSIEQLSARASLDEMMLIQALEGMEFFGIFKKKKNGLYYVPETITYGQNR